MAKKKSPPDVEETPAELPEPVPPDVPDPDADPLPDVLDDPDGTPPELVPPPAPESSDAVPQFAASEWTPPENCIVSDDPEGTRLYKIRVGGSYYRHVSEAPDGRWVYELDQ